MAKCLMRLFVVSGVLFSGIKAEVQIHAIGNVQNLTLDTIMASQQGSSLNLHVSGTNNGLSVIIRGNGSDVPALALDGIKKLVQIIKPEHAATLYIKLYKEIIDDVRRAMPGAIKQGFEAIESIEGVGELFGVLMQSFMNAQRDKTLDLAVMQTALPKEILLGCEAAMLAFAQESLTVFYSALNSTDVSTGTQASHSFSQGFFEMGEASPGTAEDEEELLEEDDVNEIQILEKEAKEALADLVSSFMIEYLNGMVEVLAGTLEQHYTIDRVALGLALPEVLAED